MSTILYLYIIIQRYANHAGYYQFLIWARQVSILILTSLTNAKVNSDRLIVGVSAFIVCSISLALHVKIQPFIYEFQNRMEKWLMLTNMVLIFAATLYSEFLRSHIKSDSDNVWSWVFSFFILFLIFGSLLASSIYFHLWRKLYGSLKVMWNDTRNDRKMSLVELNNGESRDTYCEISEALISMDEMKVNDDRAEG